jgi:NAD(P)-dependent dehydrogenase (short-subunit alcohol dehydrogenase family)
MDLGLKGKTAVVTGGSRGIGRAVVEAFLCEGCKAAFFARDLEEGRTAARELGALGEIYFEARDAADSRTVYEFAENVNNRFGGIDCWVNNVGATVRKAGAEYSDSEIDWTTGVCFKSVVFGCQAAFRYMKKTGGAIVNVSSLAARCPSAGKSTLYGPMKAAVVNLTVTFAGEYAAYGVRVNCVLPGFTLTASLRAGFSGEEIKRNTDGALLRRAAEPAEIARPIVFLASGAASYITAASLEISGGRAVTLNPGYSYELKAREDAR